ncbi:1-(5-phosphoribosyl)-5-[(5-phosphoribosylamino)methylideneamino]imidazole-4-carboxamide isomerase [candidate division FCPU426 bacterium]|nr:1-(5-phosphoribosyl)-5-[(5-phosphoribosylamino)methylideneamino]imidazole-4-carboxamide isomerase [candidate division FCPU426 bacterium]
MLVYPAIDLRKGRCVRLVRGEVRDETVYSKEPGSMAKLWQLKGAKYLHVVDLDGALTGVPKNLKYVYQIAKAVKIPIQFGGGVRNLDLIKELLENGIRRVILGTNALSMDFLSKAIKKFGSARIVGGVDTRDGKVTVRGWKDTTDKPTIEFARELEKAGVKTVIFTDVKRDGLLSGPNFQSIKALACALDIPIIASGGISSLKDIKHLKNLEKYGVSGCIIGKAIYTGAVDLKQAIAAAG